MRTIVAVRDRAIDGFMQPFFVQAIGQAIRSFQDEINRVDTDNPLYRHPEDYDLYKIGQYDETTGTLLPQTPEMIAVGKDMKTAVSQEGQAPGRQPPYTMP